MKRRAWTNDEIEFVKENYLKIPAKEIANRLNRSLRAIYQRAKAEGLSQDLPRLTPEIETQIRRLHAQGKTDRAIADELGVNGRTMCDWRNRLGLPISDVGVQEAQLRGIQNQRKTLGIESSGQLRSLAFRRFASDNGWPESLRPREVQILNVLADRGVPMTRLELAEVIGMRTDRMIGGKLQLLIGNGPGGTYTASLMRQGFLRVIKRGSHSPGQGRGKSRHLYFLGPKAIEILEARAQCETTKNKDSTSPKCKS